AREVRDLLRAPDPAALVGAKRVRRLPELARPDRARGSARLRLRLGGRASLPRGILALLRAGGLPRRRQPADEAHPAGPWDRPAPDQPPDPRGRAGRDPRPPLGRPRRAGPRLGAGSGGAPSLRPP